MEPLDVSTTDPAEVDNRDIPAMATLPHQEEAIERDRSPTTHNTSRTLTSFPLFPMLPPKVRTRIFTLASPPVRTHFVEVGMDGMDDSDPIPRVRYWPPLPSLFYTTSESRAAIIAAQGGSFINTFATNPHIPDSNVKLYLNFDMDILFLSSRFVMGKTTTETVRFRLLREMVDSTDLQRIRRVVVTFSGKDRYAELADEMGWFWRLEVLYLLMRDPWSGTAHHKSLRYRPGVIANRIRRKLIRADQEQEKEWAEDRDRSMDVDLSEEEREFFEEERREREAMLGIWKRRRVVECERLILHDGPTRAAWENGHHWVISTQWHATRTARHWRH